MVKERKIGKVFYKCMICNKLSDLDIIRMGQSPSKDKEIIAGEIESAIRNPYTDKFCEDCDKRTLQMEVAWSYAGDALDE